MGEFLNRNRKLFGAVAFSCALTCALSANADPLLEGATNDACQLSYPVSEVISWIQHSENNDDLLDLTEDWMIGLNEFSNTSSSLLLSSYFNAFRKQAANLDESESRMACKIVKPIFGIAVVANVVKDAGGELEESSSILQLGSHASFIEEACNFIPLNIPIEYPCE
jgi:hypothetical protein